MSALSAFVAGHKVVAAAVAGLAIAGAGTVAIAAPSRPPVVTVARVIDGDTIDVTVDGQDRRIRLVNVVAPPTTGDSALLTCLGDEAADFLAERLPVGTRVRLDHGRIRRDESGRELAAVYAEDELVNAAVAAAGLAVAERTEGSGRFLQEVEAAEAEARRARRGLHDAGVPCTLPAQLEQLEREVAAVASVPLDGASPADLEERESRLAEALRAGEELQALLKGDSEAFPLSAYPTSVAAMRILVGVTNDTISEERLEVRRALGLGAAPAESVLPAQGAGTGGSGRPAESDRNGAANGLGSPAAGGPAAGGRVEPREGAPGAPPVGAGATGTGRPAGAASDAASPALEAQRRAAAEQRARQAAQQEAARRAAQEEAARRAARQEAARQAAQQEAARQAAIQEEARRAVAEQEARRAAALEAARAQEEARRAAARAAAERAAAEDAARRAEAALQERRGNRAGAPAETAQRAVTAVPGAGNAAARIRPE